MRGVPLAFFEYGFENLAIDPFFMLGVKGVFGADTQKYGRANNCQGPQPIECSRFFARFSQPEEEIKWEA